MEEAPLIFLGLLGALVTGIFYTCRLFEIPKHTPYCPLIFKDVVIAYLSTFGGQILFYQILLHFTASKPIATNLTLIFILGWFFFYNRLLPKDSFDYLYGNLRRFVAHFFYGVGFLLVAYPVATFSGSIVSLILTEVFHFERGEQEPIIALYAQKDDLLVFLSLAFLVICIVPVIEELLFRRFFLGWLTRYLQPALANFFTSLFFVSMHMEDTAGWRNLEWGSALFILSYLLGILALQKQSLAAPLGLHATFNAINVFLISWIT